MDIGIISDTHGLVRPEVYPAFEGVDLILHAGDIGGSDVLIELQPIAPVKAIAGNIDGDLLQKLGEALTLTLLQRTIHLRHVPWEIPDQKSTGPVREIFICGHSHRPLNQQAGENLYFNPGSAGPKRFDLPICVGRIKIGKNQVTGEIIHLVS